MTGVVETDVIGELVIVVEGEVLRVVGKVVETDVVPTVVGVVEAVVESGIRSQFTESHATATTAWTVGPALGKSPAVATVIVRCRAPPAISNSSASVKAAPTVSATVGTDADTEAAASSNWPISPVGAVEITIRTVVAPCEFDTRNSDPWSSAADVSAAAGSDRGMARIEASTTSASALRPPVRKVTSLA